MKTAIRASGEHKQRIVIHVAVDGLKIRDEKSGVSLLNIWYLIWSNNYILSFEVLTEISNLIFNNVWQDCLYHHPVHKISFIAQDVADNRAFGYIYGSPENGHRFFGIKTEKAAGQVYLNLASFTKLFLWVMVLQRFYSFLHFFMANKGGCCDARFVSSGFRTEKERNWRCKNDAWK